MNRLGRVIVFASDVARMRAFYAAILGAPIEDTPDWVVFGGSAAQLVLHAIPPAYAPALAEPARAREDSAIKYVFVVDDLEATRARLVELGAQMRAPRADGSCDGCDPEGNVFQLAVR